MTDIAIKVENLSKLYQIGTQRSGSLRESLSENWNRLTGKSRNRITEDFWALQDIHFEIKKGEAVGIIGRNGAGKSTLLKILSRITEPTTGRIEINGRVSSLLEVGTGFHPELSGRENIYLNGTILGMTRREIKAKFDEIVDFSGVEKFIDTPVKHYSSGMYVRLAFAVAAHLEPEILIIDEVLAVGDAEFQKKCLGKMNEVAGEGRTVIFVSHNMASVQSLCSQALVLKSGQVIYSKNVVEKAINFYNQSLLDAIQQNPIIDRHDRSGSGRLRFTDLQFLHEDGYEITLPVCGDPIRIRVHYTAQQLMKNVSIAIGFNSLTGESRIVLWTNLVNANYDLSELTGFFECNIERFPLTPGKYFINLFSQSHTEVLDWLQEAYLVEVQDGDYFGTGRSVTEGYNTVLISQNWR
jgi:lipopolysaccharide transport system ATP-binding protein